MQCRIYALFLILGFTLAVAMWGCGSQENAVVATVGNEHITLGEFNAQYEKGNGGKEGAKKATVEDRQKFLDLYTMFRLKVMDAYAQGYDHDPDILAELRQYRRNLAVTYLINSALTEPALHRMYERQSTDVRVSHILLQVSAGATPQDTLLAYEKAMKIIDSLKNGRSFEELALNNSMDANVKRTKGDLYYFSGGMMVPEFEDAAYSVQPGTVVPYPVRTRFGYHIIKVTGREPSPGSVRVSHIMIRLTPKSTGEDSANAMTQLENILDSLKHGAKFEDMAMRYSQDNYTKGRGGDLGFLTRGRTIPQFDTVAFKLKPGETSGIVTTPFGLHLIHATDYKPVQSYDEMVQQLRTQYEQVGFQKDFNAYAAGLKAEYHFAESNDAIAAWRTSLDSVRMRTDTLWDTLFTQQTRAMTVYSFAGRNFSVDSVIRWIKADPELEQLPVSSPMYVSELLKRASDKMVVAYKAESLESTFPGFEQTIKEYEEGSMLFKAEQNAVWNKIVVNDSTLRPYFEAHRSEYRWPDRVSFREIFVNSDSTAQVVSFLLDKQHLPFDSVAAHYNSRLSTKSSNGEWGLNDTAANELYSRAGKMNVGEVSGFFPYENGFSIIKVISKDPARTKTLTEAGPEVSSAYQEAESKALESEWENALRSKYPVKEYKELLGSAPATASAK
ncbi:MAG TPA: peptidylprolyl isomerase [Bacteroidota bacterium]|nr:peptidylprolyl isomerase [Bacteroidota bacterium]